MPTPYDELFDYLERDLACGPAVAAAPAVAVDPLLLVGELANADWTDVEAGREVARHVTGAAIRNAQSALVCELMRSTGVNVRGVRMSRILWAALDAAA